MTASRRLEGVTIVGLVLISLALGWNTVRSHSQSVDGVAPRRLEVASIDLSAGSRDATFSAHGMVPGDSVAAAVTIVNSGRQTMTYSMSRGLVSVGGSALSAALIVTIKTVGSSCADYDGTTLYEGPLDAAAIGSEGNGRALAGATAEILCFRAVLPIDAGDALQDAATTVTLSFGAS